MNVILAKSLLLYTTEQLTEILTGSFVLRFDDGDVETNYREVIYSSHVWDFHRKFPEIPLLKSHHLTDVLKGKRLGSSTHLTLLGNVMWDVYEHYKGKPGFENVVSFRNSLSKMVYEANQAMYNTLIYATEAHVVSMDILDFLEVRDYPVIANVLNNLTADQKSIDLAYKTIDTALLYDEGLSNSRIAKAYKSNLINRNQTLQCLGPRGYLTDIDSIMFDIPIMRGYFEGIRRMYDSMIESRSGAKHLTFSKDIIKKAEYFSRRLQVLCQTFKNLHVGDCGSTKYLSWTIKPGFKDNTKSFKGDLHHLRGKFYLDEVSNTLKIVSENDVHLVGKTLKLRSFVAGCSHPDPYGVCSTCFGQLSDSVPENTNIGHLCATTMAAQSTQMLLSTKHHESSSMISGIVLPKIYSKHVRVSQDAMSYLFAEDIRNQSPKLVVKQKDVFGLTNIDIVEDVNSLVVSRVSATKMIGIRTVVGYDDMKFPVYDNIGIPVSIGKRMASLTTEMLIHIKKEGYTIDNKGNVVIDLSEWDYSLPALVMPMKHYNMGDHSGEIARIIESVVIDFDKRATDKAPEETLYELYEVVNEKLDINLAVLEIIVGAAMAIDPVRNNYNLPKSWTTRAMGVSSLTIANRSTSGPMAYEGQREVIYSPKSFFNEGKPSHPMDVFLMPAQAVADALTP
jgi:hypothetical protein